MSGDKELNSWGSSHIRVQKFCYEWTISNFSFCVRRFRRKIQSPVFSLGDNDEVAWCLRVYTNGIDEESKDYLSVYLVLLSCPERPVWATFEFWIINSQGEKHQSMKRMDAINFLSKQERGFKMFIPRDILFCHQQWLLPEDQLTLCCKVDIVGAAFSMPGQTMTPAIKDVKHVLTNDLGELWENSLFTDCSLLVAGHEFRAHKAILAARSPVFRAMFQHEMKESLTNRIEIHDLDPQVFKEMMGFIYTGKAPHLHRHSMATGLLAAADKYDLAGLKVLCEEALCRNLSVKNAAHTLILADLYSTKHLKSQVLDFIAIHASEVCETSGWESMVESYPYLVTESFHSLASAQSEFLDPSLKFLKRF